MIHTILIKHAVLPVHAVLMVVLTVLALCHVISVTSISCAYNMYLTCKILNHLSKTLQLLKSISNNVFSHVLT